MADEMTGNSDPKSRPVRNLFAIEAALFTKTRYFLLSRVGRRGAALLFFALLDVIYSFSLFRPPPDARKTNTLKFLAGILPLWVWAVIWGIGGVLCFIDAFRAHDKIGYTAAITIKTLWGSIFIVGGLVAHLDRAYVAAALWLCMGAWVAIISGWPEPPLTSKYRPVGKDVL